MSKKLIYVLCNILGLVQLSNGEIKEGSFFYKLLQTRMVNRFQPDCDEIKSFKSATRIYYEREKVKKHNQDEIYAMVKFLNCYSFCSKKKYMYIFFFKK